MLISVKIAEEWGFFIIFVARKQNYQQNNKT